MTSKLNTLVANDPFFACRIRPGSPNVFTSEIVSYRLTRTGKDTSGNLIFPPRGHHEDPFEGCNRYESGRRNQRLLSNLL